MNCSWGFATNPCSKEYKGTCSPRVRADLKIVAKEGANRVSGEIQKHFAFVTNLMLSERDNEDKFQRSTVMGILLSVGQNCRNI